MDYPATLWGSTGVYSLNKIDSLTDIPFFTLSYARWFLWEVSVAEVEIILECQTFSLIDNKTNWLVDFIVLLSRWGYKSPHCTWWWCRLNSC